MTPALLLGQRAILAWGRVSIPARREWPPRTAGAGLARSLELTPEAIRPGTLLWRRLTWTRAQKQGRRSVAFLTPHVPATGQQQRLQPLLLVQAQRQLATKRLGLAPGPTEADLPLGTVERWPAATIRVARAAAGAGMTSEAATARTRVSLAAAIRFQTTQRVATGAWTSLCASQQRMLPPTLLLARTRARVRIMSRVPRTRTKTVSSTQTARSPALHLETNGPSCF